MRAEPRNHVAQITQFQGGVQEKNSGSRPVRSAWPHFEAPRNDSQLARPDMSYWAQVTSNAAGLESDGNDDDEASEEFSQDETRSDVDMQQEPPANLARPGYNHMFPSPVQQAHGIGTSDGSCVSHPSPSKRKQVALRSTRSKFIKRLADCSGSMSVNDRSNVHYYGPSSIFHLSDSSHLSATLPAWPTSSQLERSYIQAGLEWKPDTEYEDQLVNLFFAWHNPALHAVDKSVFIAAQSRAASAQATQFFSPFLKDSLLAVGALFANNRSHPHIPQKSRASEFFASRARLSLESELSDPSLATIQGLLVLSQHAAAEAQDSRGMCLSLLIVSISLAQWCSHSFGAGWIYSGMTRVADYNRIDSLLNVV